jgi:hypothetical protein
MSLKIKAREPVSPLSRNNEILSEEVSITFLTESAAGVKQCNLKSHAALSMPFV